MDFADATLVHLGEREAITAVFTLDQNDFATYRINGVRRFHILPSRGPDALYAIFNCRMTTTREISLGSLRLGGNNPLFLIAGPCVIESERHARMMAERVAKIAADAGVPYIFKASYDKANARLLSPTAARTAGGLAHPWQN